MSEELLTYRIIISGRVQGVFFRATMKDVADENNILGWVRNLNDGRVESLVRGRKTDLNKIIEWCRLGPDGARVDEIEVSLIQDTGRLQNFTILL